MPPRRTRAARRRLRSPTPGPSSSSNVSGADFRLRLQSCGATDEQPPGTPEQVSDAPQKVIEQFQADFGFEPSPPPTMAKRPGAKTPESVHGSVLRLQEVFTQAGSAIHANAVGRLIEAHGEIEHQISRFVTKSSAALQSNRAIYDNIEYPLSSTLCSDETHTSATVSAHLQELADDLDQAEQKLRALNRDWDACVDVEDKAWAQLTNRAAPEPHASGLDDSLGTDEPANFQRRARDIAQSKRQMIEALEEDYKEMIRAETTNILQHMM